MLTKTNKNNKQKSLKLLNKKGILQILTDLIRRLGDVENVSGVVAFLASDDASYITGETIVVAGGMASRL